MKDALTRAEVLYVLRHGKKNIAQTVVMYYHQTNTPLRFAVIVPKKNTPLASQRNTVKRVCREELRSTKTTLHGMIVCMCNSSTQVRENLQLALKKYL